jgi:hypothetical protein
MKKSSRLAGKLSAFQQSPCSMVLVLIAIFTLKDLAEATNTSYCLSAGQIRICGKETKNQEIAGSEVSLSLRYVTNC